MFNKRVIRGNGWLLSKSVGYPINEGYSDTENQGQNRENQGHVSVRELDLGIKIRKKYRNLFFGLKNQLFLSSSPLVARLLNKGQLLLAIYGHFAQTEREYISMRTKQGLAAARAQGKVLGRPKGSKNKERVLDPHKGAILEYLRVGLNLAAIMKLVNPQLDKPVTYNTFRYFVQHEKELLHAWQLQKVSNGL